PWPYPSDGRRGRPADPPPASRRVSSSSTSQSPVALVSRRPEQEGPRNGEQSREPPAEQLDGGASPQVPDDDEHAQDAEQQSERHGQWGSDLRETDQRGEHHKNRGKCSEREQCHIKEAHIQFNASSQDNEYYNVVK